MLRSLPLVSVRQQQNQPAGLPPLGFGAGNELVDHDLGAVCEIAELRLPHHQRQRIGDAVAELESQDRKLAERAVENIESGLVRRQMLQGHILAPGLGVVKTQVALAEGAAAGILAAQPHGRAF